MERLNLKNIKVGIYSIRAELEGYVTAVENVTIEEDQTASVVLRMKESQVNNQPPSNAFNPSPADGFKDLGLSLDLKWEATDPDEDELKYDLYLFDDETPQSNLMASDLSDPIFTVEKPSLWKNLFLASCS